MRLARAYVRDPQVTVNLKEVVGRVFTVGIAVLFGVGALAIPGGFIWFIVGLVRNASKASTAPPPQPPPPQPPGAGQPG